MQLPRVSCIMPTYNRRQFIPFAIAYFLKQDYLNLELVIVDDGDESIIDLIPQSIHIKYHYNANRQSVGLKRNEACQIAGGDIIVHLDDDDWYAPDWVTHQVKELMGSHSDICGLNEIIFYDSNFDFYWQCIDTDRVKPWIHGATLVYWKSFWKKHLFKDRQAGEDNDFTGNNHASLHAYRFYDGYLGGLNQVQFYLVLTNIYWVTKNMNSKKQWLSGATLAYHKSFWKKHPFKNLQIGEDDDFVRNNGAKIFAHNYYQGFIAVIHARNTTVKVFQ